MKCKSVRLGIPQNDVLKSALSTTASRTLFTPGEKTVRCNTSGKTNLTPVFGW